MKLSQKLADFDNEIENAVPYIAANNERLGVSKDQSDEQDAFKTEWDAKYSIYKSPTTHTEQSVIDVNDVYHDFHPAYNGIKQQIKNNRGVTLTGTDITTLHIHVDVARRHHVPAPEFSPNNTVIKTTHLVSRIFTNNPNSPHEKETAMPKDITKIGRKMAVVASGAPAPGPEQYHNLDAVGTTSYDLIFAAEQEGAKAYLITWYENNRGEKGPQSPVLSFIIA